MAAALQEAMDETLRRLRPRPTSEAQAVSGKTFRRRGFRRATPARVRPPAYEDCASPHPLGTEEHDLKIVIGAMPSPGSVVSMAKAPSLIRPATRKSRWPDRLSAT